MIIDMNKFHVRTLRVVCCMLAPWQHSLVLHSVKLLQGCFSFSIYMANMHNRDNIGLDMLKYKFVFDKSNAN